MMPSIFESFISNIWPVILQIRRKILREHHCRCRSGVTLTNHSSRRHKRRVAEYLLSHFTSCGLPAVKLFLVALLEGVSDRAKAEALSPTIQALTDKERASEWERLFGSQFEEFVTITVSALDSSISGHLNDTSGTLWPIFLDAIKFYFQPGKLSVIQTCRVSRLTHLRVTYSAERCSLQDFAKWSVLSLVSRSPDGVVYVHHRHRFGVIRCCEVEFSFDGRHNTNPTLQKPYCVSLFAKVLSGAQLLIQLVTELRPKPKDTPDRATKRAKVVE
jgi:hypothetical protein